MTRRTRSAILWVVFVSGCAVGRKHAYDLATPQLRQPGTAWLAVAATDDRVEVISGRKGSIFVGLSRGGWGNTFDVTTTSGRPLASEFTSAIARGLRASGYRVTPVSASPGQLPKNVALAFARTGASAGLLVQLTEWKSDTYNNTALIYDVTMQVLDPQGHVLGQARIRGRDNLGGSFWDPPSHAEAAIPGAFRGKLEELLNAPEIIRGLQAVGGAPVAPAMPQPDAPPPSPPSPPAS